VSTFFYVQVFQELKNKFGLHHKLLYVCCPKARIAMRPIIQIIFLILLICFPDLLSAQTTIAGKVTDKKNPLIGVSITLKDTYDGATSDSSGKYSFKTSEKGEFILTLFCRPYAVPAISRIQTSLSVKTGSNSGV